MTSLNILYNFSQMRYKYHTTYDIQVWLYVRWDMLHVWLYKKFSSFSVSLNFYLFVSKVYWKWYANFIFAKTFHFMKSIANDMENWKWKWKFECSMLWKLGIYYFYSHQISKLNSLDRFLDNILNVLIEIQLLLFYAEF